jgi:hypothetical protein
VLKKEELTMDNQGVIATLNDLLEISRDAAKAAYEAALQKSLPANVRTLIERQYEGVKANHVASAIYTTSQPDNRAGPGEPGARSRPKLDRQHSVKATAKPFIVHGWARWADPRSAARREPGSVEKDRFGWA